ncbi:hypothetical protein QAD02_016698 [Eretmocerus hayati]|uniref:Uncharacterized protein n=1 Tax=Eretmocerus hayati TaxID=131215 RepID=A0ACC2PD38_9HYME|nr:hypothetical protein QAD02_016698 [Eretmocerus hayati]
MVEASDDREEHDDASKIDLVYIHDCDNDDVRNMELQCNANDENIEDENIEDENIEDENIEDENIEDENGQDIHNEDDDDRVPDIERVDGKRVQDSDKRSKPDDINIKAFVYGPFPGFHHDPVEGTVPFFCEWAEGPKPEDLEGVISQPFETRDPQVLGHLKLKDTATDSYEVKVSFLPNHDMSDRGEKLRKQHFLAYFHKRTQMQEEGHDMVGEVGDGKEEPQANGEKFDQQNVGDNVEHPTNSSGPGSQVEEPQPQAKEVDQRHVEDGVVRMVNFCIFQKNEANPTLDCTRPRTALVLVREYSLS